VLDGRNVATLDGLVVGSLVGSLDGFLDGYWVGLFLVGAGVGRLVGLVVATGANVGRFVGGLLGDDLGVNVGRIVGRLVEYCVGAAVGCWGTGFADVGVPVGDWARGCSVGAAARIGVGVRIGGGARALVGSGVGDRVGRSVGLVVGSFVGSHVGIRVGRLVESRIGGRVGLREEGFGLGAFVGLFVATRTGDLVGAGVGRTSESGPRVGGFMGANRGGSGSSKGTAVVGVRCGARVVPLEGFGVEILAGAAVVSNGACRGLAVCAAIGNANMGAAAMGGATGTDKTGDKVPGRTGAAVTTSSGADIGTNGMPVVVTVTGIGGSTGTTTKGTSGLEAAIAMGALVVRACMGGANVACRGAAVTVSRGAIDGVEIGSGITGGRSVVA
jgi:hypothetical protein